METRFLWVISIFTGVTSVALLVQMLVLVGLYRGMKQLQERMITLADRLDPILENTRRII